MRDPDDLQALFDALSRDAAAAGPGPGAAMARARGRRRMRAGAAGLALVLLAGGGTALALQPGPQQEGLRFAGDPTPSPEPTPSATASVGQSPAASPSTAPSPTPVPPATVLRSPGSAASPGVRSVTVYYVADTTNGLRLYRETHQRRTTPGVVRDAVEAMLGEAPYDDDYASPWAAGTRVLGANIEGDVAIIDLSKEAAVTNGGSAAAEMAVQQLVWTVHDAATNIRAVRILIEGKAPADFWGALALVEPVERAPSQNVLGPVWLDLSPGAELSRGQKFGGEATVFEATVSWEWLKGGQVVDEGFSTADGGAPGRGDWSATVDVPPGDYVLRAFSSSAEDGSRMFVDDKEVRVTG
ncbi:MAG: GerMN domain-containing protein [Actinomycetota bacterium]|nr:GerMN domain-containing protein [Actinomycetota bacterium]